MADNSYNPYVGAAGNTSAGADITRKNKGSNQFTERIKESMRVNGYPEEHINTIFPGAEEDVAVPISPEATDLPAEKQTPFDSNGKPLTLGKGVKPLYAYDLIKAVQSTGLDKTFSPAEIENQIHNEEFVANIENVLKEKYPKTYNKLLEKKSDPQQNIREQFYSIYNRDVSDFNLSIEQAKMAIDDLNNKKEAVYDYLVNKKPNAKEVNDAVEILQSFHGLAGKDMNLAQQYYDRNIAGNPIFEDLYKGDALKLLKKTWDKNFETTVSSDLRNAEHYNPDYAEHRQKKEAERMAGLNHYNENMSIIGNSYEQQYQQRIEKIKGVKFELEKEIADLAKLDKETTPFSNTSSSSLTMVPGNMSNIYTSRNQYLNISDNFLDDVNSILEQVETGNVQDLMAGIWNGTKKMALYDVRTLAPMIPIIEKVNKNEPLNKMEEAALRSYALLNYVNASVDKSVAYEAGQSIPGSIEFMANLYVTAGAFTAVGKGVGMAVEKGLRAAMLKEANSGIKRAIAGSLKKWLPGTLGMLAGNAAITPGQLMFYNDYYRERTGQGVTMTADQEGNLAVNTDNAELQGYWESIGKAFGHTAVESISESFGGFANKQLRGLVKSPKLKKFFTTTDNWKKSARFDGFGMEYVEELMANVMNLPIDGWESFKESMSLHNLAVTAVSVGLVSGGIHVYGTKSRKALRDTEKEIVNSEIQLQMKLGDKLFSQFLQGVNDATTTDQRASFFADFVRNNDIMQERIPEMVKYLKLRTDYEVKMEDIVQTKHSKYTETESSEVEDRVKIQANAQNEIRAKLHESNPIEMAEIEATLQHELNDGVTRNAKQAYKNYNEAVDKLVKKADPKVISEINTIHETAKEKHDLLNVTYGNSELLALQVKLKKGEALNAHDEAVLTHYGRNSTNLESIFQKASNTLTEEAKANLLPALPKMSDKHLQRALDERNSLLAKITDQESLQKEIEKINLQIEKNKKNKKPFAHLQQLIQSLKYDTSEINRQLLKREITLLATYQQRRASIKAQKEMREINKGMLQGHIEFTDKSGTPVKGTQSQEFLNVADNKSNRDAAFQKNNEQITSLTQLGKSEPRLKGHLQTQITALEKDNQRLNAEYNKQAEDFKLRHGSHATGKPVTMPEAQDKSILNQEVIVTDFSTGARVKGKVVAHAKNTTGTEVVVEHLSGEKMDEKRHIRIIYNDKGETQFYELNHAKSQAEINDARMTGKELTDFSEFYVEKTQEEKDEWEKYYDEIERLQALPADKGYIYMDGKVYFTKAGLYQEFQALLPTNTNMLFLGQDPATAQRRRAELMAKYGNTLFTALLKAKNGSYFLRVGKASMLPYSENERYKQLEVIKENIRAFVDMRRHQHYLSQFTDKQKAEAKRTGKGIVLDLDQYRTMINREIEEARYQLDNVSETDFENLKRRTRITSLLTAMENILGVKFIIHETNEDPAQLRKGWEDNNEFHIVMDVATGDVPFHEYSHPIIDDLERMDPDITKNLYEQILASTDPLMQKVVADVIALYPEYNESRRRKEIIVTALGHLGNAAFTKSNNRVVQKLYKLWNGIKLWIKMHWGSGVKVTDKTTMHELADLIVSGQLVSDHRRTEIREINQAKAEEAGEFYVDIKGVQIRTPFKLNDEQVAALDAMADFVRNEDPEIKSFALQGFAGTGKTTIVNYLIKYLVQTRQFSPKQIRLASPTHRANSVLRRSTSIGQVTTLHASLGLSTEIDLDNLDTKNLEFVPVKDVTLNEGDIFIIDESSMIKDNIFDQVTKVARELGVKIIFMGDIGQIPPVNQNHKSKALTSADAKAELIKIERTQESPLLNTITNIRNSTPGTNVKQYRDVSDNKENGVEYFNKEDDFIGHLLDIFKSKAFKDNPLLIRGVAYDNDEVTRLNKLIAQQILDSNNGIPFIKGMVLMGYTNQNKVFSEAVKRGEKDAYRITNGVDYIITSASDKIETKEYFGVPMQVQRIVIKKIDSNEEAYETYIQVGELSKEQQKQIIANHESAARFASQNRMWGPYYAKMSAVVLTKGIEKGSKTPLPKAIDYGYFHTIHKSQGGTYQYIAIAEKALNQRRSDAITEHEKEEVKALEYTAFSRARQKAFVFTNHPVNMPDMFEAVFDPLSEQINIMWSSGQHKELSNFATRHFFFNGLFYHSVEHAYQTWKKGSFDVGIYDRMNEVFEKNGYAGKEQGVDYGKAKTENDYSEKLMFKILRSAWATDRDALMNTGMSKLTHNGQRIDFWTEKFPELLMKTREFYRQSKSVPIVQQKQEEKQKEGENTREAKKPLFVGQEEYDRLIAEAQKLPGFPQNANVKEEHLQGKKIWSEELNTYRNDNTTSIDLITEGQRYRTTRSDQQMKDLDPKVGQYRIMFGFDSNGGKVSHMVVITDIYGRGDDRFRDNWKNEGWHEDEFDAKITKKHTTAIEFRLVQVGDPSLNQVDVAAELAKRIQAVKDTYYNNSGGAEGADSYGDESGRKHGFNNHKHWYYEDDIWTEEQKAKAKPKLGNEKQELPDHQTGLIEAQSAAKAVGKNWTRDPFKQALLARNWNQVKYSDAIYMVGHLLNDGDVSTKPPTFYKGVENPPFKNQTGRQTVDGGTQYAFEMARANGKEIHLFNVRDNKWYTWKGGKFEEELTPVLTKNYAVIGTRQITTEGKLAIDALYANTERMIRETIDQPTNLVHSSTYSEDSKLAYNLSISRAFSALQGIVNSQILAEQGIDMNDPVIAKSKGKSKRAQIREARQEALSVFKSTTYYNEVLTASQRKSRILMLSAMLDKMLKKQYNTINDEGKEMLTESPDNVTHSKEQKLKFNLNVVSALTEVVMKETGLDKNTVTNTLITMFSPEQIVHDPMGLSLQEAYDSKQLLHNLEERYSEDNQKSIAKVIAENPAFTYTNYVTYANIHGSMHKEDAFSIFIENDGKVSVHSQFHTVEIDDIRDTFKDHMTRLTKNEEAFDEIIEIMDLTVDLFATKSGSEYKGAVWSDKKQRLTLRFLSKLTGFSEEQWMNYLKNPRTLQGLYSKEIKPFSSTQSISDIVGQSIFFITGENKPVKVENVALMASILSGYKNLTKKGEYKPTQEEFVDWLYKFMTTTKGKTTNIDFVAESQVSEEIGINGSNISGKRSTSINMSHQLWDALSDNQDQIADQQMREFIQANGVKLANVDGTMNFANRGIFAETLQNKDVALFSIVTLFNQGNKSYYHFLGQFSDKTDLYTLEVPKLEATQENINLARTHNTNFDKDVKAVEKLLEKYATNLRLEISASEFALQFVTNFVLNTYTLAPIIHGSMDQYHKNGKFDMTDFIKRAQVIISPGYKMQVNIGGAMQEKMRYVIANDYLSFEFTPEEIEEIDGKNFLSSKAARKIATSQGELLSKTKIYESNDSIKAVVTGTLDQKRLLIKSHLVNIDVYANTFKDEPIYQKIRDYMAKHDIDVIAFPTSAKKSAGQKETVLFHNELHTATQEQIDKGKSFSMDEFFKENGINFDSIGDALNNEEITPDQAWKQMVEQLQAMPEESEIGTKVNALIRQIQQTGKTLVHSENINLHSLLPEFIGRTQRSALHRREIFDDATPNVLEVPRSMFYVQQDLRHETHTETQDMSNQMYANAMALDEYPEFIKHITNANKMQQDFFTEAFNQFKDVDQLKMYLLSNIDENSSEYFDGYREAIEQWAIADPRVQQVVFRQIANLTTRDILEVKLNRQSSVEIADMNGKLLSRRRPSLKGFEDKVLLPEFATNIPNIRYAQEFATRVEAEAALKSNQHLYADLYDFVDREVEGETISMGMPQNWQIYVDPSTAKYILPGEPIASSRTPAGNLNCHSIGRARYRIESKTAFMMIDRQSRRASGSDFDGDARYNWVQYSNKNGAFLRGSYESEVNLALMELVHGYEKATQSFLIEEAIDTKMFNPMINQMIDQWENLTKDKPNNQYSVTDILTHRDWNMVGFNMKAVMSKLTTTFSYFKYFGVHGIVKDRYNAVKVVLDNLLNISFDNAKDPVLYKLGLNEASATTFVLKIISDPRIDRAGSYQEAMDITMQVLQEVADIFSPYGSYARKEIEYKDAMEAAIVQAMDEQQKNNPQTVDTTLDGEEEFYGGSLDDTVFYEDSQIAQIRLQMFENNEMRDYVNVLHRVYAEMQQSQKLDLLRDRNTYLKTEVIKAVRPFMNTEMEKDASKIFLQDVKDAEDINFFDNIKALRDKVPSTLADYTRYQSYLNEFEFGVLNGRERMYFNAHIMQQRDNKPALNAIYDSMEIARNIYNLIPFTGFVEGLRKTHTKIVDSLIADKQVHKLSYLSARKTRKVFEFHHMPYMISLRTASFEQTGKTLMGYLNDYTLLSTRNKFLDKIVSSQIGSKIEIALARQYRQTDFKDATLEAIQKDFAILPMDIKKKFIYYSILQHGMSYSSSNGGMLKFVDKNTRLAIAQETMNITKNEYSTLIGQHIMHSVNQDARKLAENITDHKELVATTDLIHDMRSYFQKENYNFNLFLQDNTLFDKLQDPAAYEGEEEYHQARQNAIQQINLQNDAELDAVLKSLQAIRQNLRYQSDSVIDDSELLFDDPLFFGYLMEHFQQMYPDLEVFTDPKQFAEFIRKQTRRSGKFDLSQNGAAFANAIYLNEKRARQHTLFHEVAHIFWDGTKDQDPVKNELRKLYGWNGNMSQKETDDIDEMIIQDIGIMGTRYAKMRFTGSFRALWNERLKNFWIFVKKTFGTLSGGKFGTDKYITQYRMHNLKQEMSARIWNNDNSNRESVRKFLLRYQKGNFNDARYGERSIMLNNEEYSAASPYFDSCLQHLDNKLEKAKLIYQEAQKEIYDAQLASIAGGVIGTPKHIRIENGVVHIINSEGKIVMPGTPANLIAEADFVDHYMANEERTSAMHVMSSFFVAQATSAIYGMPSNHVLNQGDFSLDMDFYFEEINGAYPMMEQAYNATEEAIRNFLRENNYNNNAYSVTSNQTVYDDNAKHTAFVDLVITNRQTGETHIVKFVPTFDGVFDKNGNMQSWYSRTKGLFINGPLSKRPVSEEEKVRVSMVQYAHMFNEIEMGRSNKVVTKMTVIPMKVTMVNQNFISNYQQEKTGNTLHRMLYNYTPQDEVLAKQILDHIAQRKMRTDSYREETIEQSPLHTQGEREAVEETLGAIRWLKNLFKHDSNKITTHSFNILSKTGYGSLMDTVLKDLGWDTSVFSTDHRRIVLASQNINPTLRIARKPNGEGLLVYFSPGAGKTVASEYSDDIIDSNDLLGDILYNSLSGGFLVPGSAYYDLLSDYTSLHPVDLNNANFGKDPMPGEPSVVDLKFFHDKFIANGESINLYATEVSMMIFAVQKQIINNLIAQGQTPFLNVNSVNNMESTRTLLHMHNVSGPDIQLLMMRSPHELLKRRIQSQLKTGKHVVTSTMMKDNFRHIFNMKYDSVYRLVNNPTDTAENSNEISEKARQLMHQRTSAENRGTDRIDYVEQGWIQDRFKDEVKSFDNVNINDPNRLIDNPSMIQYMNSYASDVLFNEEIHVKKGLVSSLKTIYIISELGLKMEDYLFYVKNVQGSPNVKTTISEWVNEKWWEYQDKIDFEGIERKAEKYNLKIFESFGMSSTLKASEYGKEVVDRYKSNFTEAGKIWGEIGTLTGFIERFDYSNAETEDAFDEMQKNLILLFDRIDKLDDINKQGLYEIVGGQIVGNYLIAKTRQEAKEGRSYRVHTIALKRLLEDPGVNFINSRKKTVLMGIKVSAAVRWMANVRSLMRLDRAIDKSVPLEQILFEAKIDTRHNVMTSIQNIDAELDDMYNEIPEKEREKLIYEYGKYPKGITVNGVMIYDGDKVKRMIGRNAFLPMTYLSMVHDSGKMSDAAYDYVMRIHELMMQYDTRFAKQFKKYGANTPMFVADITAQMNMTTNQGSSVLFHDRSEFSTAVLNGYGIDIDGAKQTKFRVKLYNTLKTDNSDHMILDRPGSYSLMFAKYDDATMAEVKGDFFDPDVVKAAAIASQHSVQEELEERIINYEFLRKKASEKSKIKFLKKTRSLRVRGGYNEGMVFRTKQYHEATKILVNSLISNFHVAEVTPISYFIESKYMKETGAKIKDMTVDPMNQKWVTKYIDERIYKHTDADWEDLNPAYRAIGALISISSLGLNVRSGIGNLTAGQLQNWIMATKLQHRNVQSLALLPKVVRIMKNNYVGMIMEDVKFKESDAVYEWILRKSFIITEKVENLNQGLMFMSQMTDEELDMYGDDGKPLDPDNQMSPFRIHQIESKVRETHGDYGHNRPLYSSNALLMEMGRFKWGWWQTMMNNHFGTSYVDIWGTEHRSILVGTMAKKLEMMMYKLRERFSTKEALLEFVKDKIGKHKQADFELELSDTAEEAITDRERKSKSVSTYGSQVFRLQMPDGSTKFYAMSYADKLSIQARLALELLVDKKDRVYLKSDERDKENMNKLWKETKAFLAYGMASQMLQALIAGALMGGLNPDGDDDESLDFINAFWEGVNNKRILTWINNGYNRSLEFLADVTGLEVIREAETRIGMVEYTKERKAKYVANFIGNKNGLIDEYDALWWMGAVDNYLLQSMKDISLPYNPEATSKMLSPDAIAAKTWLGNVALAVVAAARIPFDGGLETFGTNNADMGYTMETTKFWYYIRRSMPLKQPVQQLYNQMYMQREDIERAQMLELSFQLYKEHMSQVNAFKGIKFDINDPETKSKREEFNAVALGIINSRKEMIIKRAREDLDDKTNAAREDIEENKTHYIRGK